MQIAERALLRDKKHLKQHRKKFPCAFEHVTESPDEVIRYYFDEPAFRLGDALKAQLEKSGDVLDSLIFFQPFDDDWYGCVFEAGELEREFVGSIPEIEAEFSFELYQADQVLVTESGLPFFPEKHVIVPPLTEEHWREFALKAVRGTPQKKVGAVGLLILSSLIGGYLAFSPASKPVPPPSASQQSQALSEREIFEEAFASYPSAYSYIESALAMLIEAQTLPPSMKLTHIEKEFDGNLGFQWLKGVVEMSESRVKERRDWMNEPVKRFVRWDESKKVLLSPPLNTRPWRDVTVDSYSKQAVDALELLGVEVRETETKDWTQFSAQHFVLSGEASLGKLHLIATILNAPFVTATDFSLSVQGENKVNFSIEIQIQGVNLD